MLALIYVYMLIQKWHFSSKSRISLTKGKTSVTFSLDEKNVTRLAQPSHEYDMFVFVEKFLHNLKTSQTKEVVMQRVG